MIPGGKKELQMLDVVNNTVGTVGKQKVKNNSSENEIVMEIVNEVTHLISMPHARLTHPDPHLFPS